MDECTRNAFIVDAKRRAKAHSRTTGESHQRSLDHIAKLRGREDWNAFLADPIGEDAPPTPLWISLIQRSGRAWPRTTSTIGVLFLLASMIVANIGIAGFGDIVSYRLPMAVWLPFATAWGAVGAWFAWMMVRESIRTLVLMRNGVVDSTRVMLLLYTMLAPIIALDLWMGWTYAEAGVPLIALSLLPFVFVYATFFIAMPRRRRDEATDTRTS